MMLTIREKKALYAFGCARREATVQRLLLAAALSPEPAVKKFLTSLADKLDSEDAGRWYSCFFYNMRLEIEAYLYHESVLEKISGGSMEVDADDETDED